MGVVLITIVGHDFRVRGIRVGSVMSLVVLVHMTPLQDFFVIMNMIDGLRSNSRLRVRLVLVIGTVYVAYENVIIIALNEVQSLKSIQSAYLH